MSWGTQFEYTDYLRGIGKKDLDYKYRECEDLNDMFWNQILAMCAMTPPAYAKSEEGYECPWAEYLDMKLREFREQIEDNCRLMERISCCKEALEENPDKVIEG